MKQKNMNYAKILFDIKDENGNVIKKETVYVSTGNNNPKKVFEDSVYYMFSNLKPAQ